MIKLKLDEHFGTSFQDVFLKSGFDVETVRQEKLLGISDKELFEVCIQEKRCLVTFDLHFSDIIRFPPYNSYGIAILRPRGRTSTENLKQLMKQFINYLKNTEIRNQLWIVEPKKIRIHKKQ